MKQWQTFVTTNVANPGKSFKLVYHKGSTIWFPVTTPDDAIRYITELIDDVTRNHS